MLTKAEVAERYRTSIRNVSRWVVKKQIPHIRINKKIVRFDEAALDRFDQEKLIQPQ
jgi:hypothetical protein